MEKLMEAVINLARADPTKPLTPERRNHIEQRLHQLFPVLHTPSHPAYAAMIHRAIVELNEEEGSSEESISGFIKRVYDDLPWAHAILLSHHLGKLTEKGEIVVTGNNCYMVPVVNPNFEVQNVDQEESLSLEQDSQVNEGHPNLEARGRKRKCGRGRRHEEYEIVEEEEESQSHEQQSELNEEKTNLEARGRKRKHGRGICSTENQIVVEAEEEEEEEWTEEKPNLEARGWKQKRGRGRRRRANENAVEEEIQSRSKVKAEKNREKGEIEVVEEQSQLERPQIEVIEGVNQQEIKIEASAEQNQPTGQPCELIEELPQTEPAPESAWRESSSPVIAPSCIEVAPEGQTKSSPGMDPMCLAEKEAFERRRCAAISRKLEAQRQQTFGPGSPCYHAPIIEEEFISDDITGSSGPPDGQETRLAPQPSHPATRTRVRVSHNILMYEELKMVHGLLMRAFVAPYLERVIKRYGAVDAECRQKSQLYRGFLAEMMVLVTLILHSNTAKSLTMEDYQFVEDNLADLEFANFRVDWLRSCFERVKPLLEVVRGETEARALAIRAGELKSILFKVEKRAREAQKAVDQLKAKVF